MNEIPVRVLIVDDEDVVSETLTAFFEDWGFRAFTAADGDTALRILKEEKIDIAIVDIRLRNYDGNTFILKAHRLQADLKFLIHTGSTSYSITPEIAAVGIKESDVLWKPIRNFNALYDTILRKVGRSVYPEPPRE
jgi:DNA-binding response OmpR family regulator